MAGRCYWTLATAKDYAAAIPAATWTFVFSNCSVKDYSVVSPRFGWFVSVERTGTVPVASAVASIVGFRICVRSR